jgi:hypothetical protein
MYVPTGCTNNNTQISYSTCLQHYGLSSTGVSEGMPLYMKTFTWNVKEGRKAVFPYMFHIILYFILGIGRRKECVCVCVCVCVCACACMLVQTQDWD